MKTRIQLPLTVLSSFCALGLVPGVQAVTFTNSTYPVESGPNPVAVADVNGDGRLDIICPDFGYRSDLPGTPGGWNTHLTVLTNGGNGIFGFYATLNVGTGPVSVAAADINGDGKPDLISANNSDSSLTVLTNNGRFSPAISMKIWSG